MTRPTLTALVNAGPHLPRILPANWRRMDPPSIAAVYGATYYVSSSGVRVVVGAEIYSDSSTWLHVSMSRAGKLPSWDDVAMVRRVFVPADRTAIQVLPPTDEHINDMPHCLHLWARMDGEALPDFRRADASGKRSL